MRSSEAAEHFFVAANQSQKKKCKMTTAFFFVREKHVSLVLFLLLVQQVPHKLTVHTTSASWELKSLRLITNVWAEREALLFAPIPQGHGLRP